MATLVQPKQKSIRPKNARLATPQQAAHAIRQICGQTPRIAIVLGSGFDAVADAFECRTSISYSQIPGFLTPDVSGHRGEVIVGKVSSEPVILLRGRTHFYEGFSLQEITFPIRSLHELGVMTLLLTNAAGAINRSFRPGEFMVVEDHINLMGGSPLRGMMLNREDRFVDLTNAYDRELSRALIQAARTLRIRVHRGVYLAVSGPNYETPGEIKAFRRLGADAIGMSTVPEVIVARQCGMRVAALSCITNMAAGVSDHPITHEEVFRTASATGAQASQIIINFILYLSSQHQSRD